MSITKCYIAYKIKKFSIIRHHICWFMNRPFGLNFIPFPASREQVKSKIVKKWQLSGTWLAWNECLVFYLLTGFCTDWDTKFLLFSRHFPFITAFCFHSLLLSMSLSSSSPPSSSSSSPSDKSKSTGTQGHVDLLPPSSLDVFWRILLGLQCLSASRMHSSCFVHWADIPGAHQHAACRLWFMPWPSLLLCCCDLTWHLCTVWPLS